MEASLLGLLNPGISDSEFSKYVSKRKMKRIQSSINPKSWDALTEDKSIFYKFCMAHGIPIPELFAIFFRKTAGWSFNKVVLRTDEDWIKFIDLELPSEFVIKPARGVYGKGISIYSRKENVFIDTSGKSYKAEELCKTMRSDPGYNCFVIQERLRNHPELVRLSDTPFLQTIRIITFYDNNGKCHILNAYLKPITGQNVIDNFDWGRTGNLFAEVLIDSGVLRTAGAMTPNFLGMEPVFTHPKSNVPFEGFQVPFWEETCMLVKDAAPKFLPVRTIGWDVALTPEGPYILEGNMWWDPSNLGKITDAEVAKVLTG